jgi:hypothetical protein
MQVPERIVACPSRQAVPVQFEWNLEQLVDQFTPLVAVTVVQPLRLHAYELALALS